MLGKNHQRNFGLGTRPSGTASLSSSWSWRGFAAGWRARWMLAKAERATSEADHFRRMASAFADEADGKIAEAKRLRAAAREIAPWFTRVVR